MKDAAGMVCERLIHFEFLVDSLLNVLPVGCAFHQESVKYTGVFRVLPENVEGQGGCKLVRIFVHHDFHRH